MDKKKVIVFDVGRTLVSITHKDIIRFFLKKGKANVFFLYIISFLFFIHKIIGINEKMVCLITKVSYKIFKGQDVDEMNNLSNEFFNFYLKKSIYNESMNIIKRHIEDGYEVVLISALFPSIVDCLKKYLNLNFIIVPELEVVDGKYSGKVLNLIPYGSNKCTLVEELVIKEGFSFNNSYAYSDRFSDLELFELVDVPVVVNPEPKLRIEANRRGWRIIDLLI